MNPNNHTYPGPKCSRTSRFPVLPPYQARVITSAPPRRCDGITGFASDPASLLPPGNKRPSTRIVTETKNLRQCFEGTIDLQKNSPAPLPTAGEKVAGLNWLIAVMRDALVGCNGYTFSAVVKAPTILCMLLTC
jgi:hypothetical protein